MIEAVSTVRAQPASLKTSSREAVSAPVTTNDVPVLKTRYRIDSMRDVVIFEYRDKEGQVLNQYPTEAQIRAFKRAAETNTEVSAPVSAPQTSAKPEAEVAGFEAPAVSAALSAGSAAAASTATASAEVSGGDDTSFSSLV